jgi:vacuolar protein sorting-associated protein 13A/C
MRLTTTLGKLTFVDDTKAQTADPSFKQLLTIDGDELADFSYETFNSDDETTFPGYNSAVKLRTGSLVFTLMERPLKQIMLFLADLSRLKAVYDRASTAAMQRASEVTRMHYDVIIKTPIVILPQDGANLRERLVLRLGQVSAKNSFGRGGNSPDSITASLDGANMTTEGPAGVLQILDNVALSIVVDDYPAGVNSPKSQKVRRSRWLAFDGPLTILCRLVDTWSIQRNPHVTDTTAICHDHGTQQDTTWHSRHWRRGE